MSRRIQTRSHHRQSRSKSRSRHNVSASSRNKQLPKLPVKKDPDEVAMLTDPRIFKTQTGGIGFACNWRIDWSLYEEERGHSWSISTGIHKRRSQKPWRPCFALSKSAIEQAAWEEMGRREAWDKEYESRFHWCPENESKKEEDHRRASWDEDYCFLLKPVYGPSPRKVKRNPCRATQLVCTWLSSRTKSGPTNEQYHRVESPENSLQGYLLQNEKFVF